jgi:hypothetical protein
MRYFLIFARTQQASQVNYRVFKMEFNIFPSGEQILAHCRETDPTLTTAKIDVTGITEIDKGAWKAY